MQLLAAACALLAVVLLAPPGAAGFGRTAPDLDGEAELEEPAPPDDEGQDLGLPDAPLPDGEAGDEDLPQPA